MITDSCPSRIRTSTNSSKSCGATVTPKDNKVQSNCIDIHSGIYARQVNKHDFSNSTYELYKYYRALHYLLQGLNTCIDDSLSSVSR